MPGYLESVKAKGRTGAADTNVDVVVIWAGFASRLANVIKLKSAFPGPGIARGDYRYLSNKQSSAWELNGS